MILSPDELVDLTGKQRGGAQSKILALLGIEHKRRPDGRIIVLREHAADVLANARRAVHAPKKSAPRLDLVK